MEIGIGIGIGNRDRDRDRDKSLPLLPFFGPWILCKGKRCLGLGFRD